MNYVGIDIGGRNLKAGLADEEDRICWSRCAARRSGRACPAAGIR